jgi:hypothetical protein
MTDEPAPRTDRIGPGPETEAARKRRLDALFGEVLPETTGDERDDRDPGSEASDRWLREQVPPHHG